MVSFWLIFKIALSPSNLWFNCVWVCEFPFGKRAHFDWAFVNDEECHWRPIIVICKPFL